MVVEDHGRMQEWESDHRGRHLEMIDLLGIDGGESVLDVGIEPFIFTELLFSEVEEQIDVVGIAYGNNGGERTENVVENEVLVRECNVEVDQWPFDDGEFDRIVMGAIIEHLFDPLSALSEARRVLADDGLLVLSTPNAVKLHTRVNTVLGKNPYDGYPSDSIYNRHNHEWTVDELRDILDVAGYDVSTINTRIHPRKGPQKLIELATRPFPQFHDQIIISARKGEVSERTPTVYRSGITEIESE